MSGVRDFIVGLVIGIWLLSEAVAGGREKKPDGNVLLPGQAKAKFTRRELREKGYHAVYADGGKTLAIQMAREDKGATTISIRFLDLTGKAPAAELPHASGISGFACSPDGKTVALGVRDNKIELWDRATGKRRAVLEGHTITVSHLSFSPDGLKLLSSTSDINGLTDGKAILWDVAKGAKLAVLHDQPGSFLSNFSPDGKMIVFGGGRANNTVFLWNVGASRNEHELKTNFKTPFSCAAFSYDGKRLVTGSSIFRPKNNPTVMTKLTLWDVDKGTVIRAWDVSRPTIRVVSFSPDGKMLASASGSIVTVWDSETGKPIAALEGRWTQCLAVAFSPDGRTLAAAGTGAGVVVWDVEMGK